MSVYRYATSELTSGVIKGDWLPLVPMNFARNINATGTFTGALNLTAGNTPAERANNILAVEPEKSVLWCFQDSVPVWCGIIWDWPHMSVLDNTLPLTCSTVESLFQKRLITDDLTFTNADIFDVFRGLAAYALGKNPAAGVAGFTMGSNESGTTTTITYAGSDKKAVYDAWTDLVTAYAFEYSIRPALDSAGNPVMVLDLGMPQLGLPLTTANLAFSLPGNLLDYRFARTGSTSANTVYASASGSGTLEALNATPTFGSGIGGWTGLNGAAGTLTTSTVWADDPNTQSLQFNGNGTTAIPLAQTEAITVQPDTAYTWQADLYSTAGWAATELQVVWYDDTGTEISSTFSTAFDVTAGTALTGSSMSVTSPDAAATAVGRVDMTGTPPAATQMLVDNAVFAVATSSQGNWESVLPHGQDTAVLAAGYPLLEESVSLSTVTVTAQAQIDGYADGVLASVSGTQLAPLLILGNDQGPAAKDIVIGSYCYFNATSPLHPAGTGGQWGLQLTGRITGWTLYPPTSAQAEVTWLQLGEIEDIEGRTYIPSGTAI